MKLRVLLVTFGDIFPDILTKVLNPQLEYCAIVTDEPEPVKNFLKQNGLDANLVYPFYELQECISDFYYDFVLCVSPLNQSWTIHQHFMKCGLPIDKFVHFEFSWQIFLVKRALTYYEQHAAEIEMFATGISYTAVGLDAAQFQYKLLNFGRSSQDLYYDYQIANRVLTPNSTGGGIRYALIGLAPYSFHLDDSKSYALNWRLLPYFIALNDLHNFWLPPEQYKNIFRAEFLASQLSIENFDLNNVNFEKSPMHFMNQNVRLKAREKVDIWKNRNYPDTRAENIKILDNYLSLCENTGVYPIMFLPPMTEVCTKYFSRQKLDEFYFLVSEAQKKHPAAIFVDGWKLAGVSDADFYDIDHLNIQGAAKFSAFLNEFIKSFEEKFH